MSARILEDLFARKAQTRMQRAAEKSEKDRDAQRGRKQGVFKNFHKQMKAPFVIYADFESVVRELPGCRLKTGALP